MEEGNVWKEELDESTGGTIEELDCNSDKNEDEPAVLAEELVVSTEELVFGRCDIRHPGGIIPGEIESGLFRCNSDSLLGNEAVGYTVVVCAKNHAELFGLKAELIVAVLDKTAIEILRRERL